jgi:hypothetical protein
LRSFLSLTGYSRYLQVLPIINKKASREEKEWEWY